MQSGPPGRRVHKGFRGGHGGQVGDADCGDDCQGSSGLFHSPEADQGDLPRVSPLRILGALRFDGAKRLLDPKRLKPIN